MTQGKTLADIPGIVIERGPSGFVLQSGRTVRLSALFRGKPMSFAQAVLPNVLGLCPVAHAEALAGAVLGQATKEAAQRVAIEAMLESVRVWCFEWKRFVDTVTVDEGLLHELGRLRQRLVVALSTRDPIATNLLYKDTQRFVQSFQAGCRDLFESALSKAKEWLQQVSVASRCCLAPSEFRDKDVLETLLAALQCDRNSAVCPRYRGMRLVGALARVAQAAEMPEEVALVTLLPARWNELSSWANAEDAWTTFVPHVSEHEGNWRIVTLETARGTLLHAAQLSDGVLEDFHMIAPTEWAFQPEGLVVDCLNRFMDRTTLRGQSLEQALRMMVALFDACTDVRIVLGEEHA